jgi:hypothetical protein
MNTDMPKGKKVKYWIFRAQFTRNGITYYARDYGKKAFRIPVYA